jgi:hypothetical protein
MMIFEGEKFRHTLISIQKPAFFEYWVPFIFSHPDYTVGFGIAPNPAPKEARGLRSQWLHYRRWGIAPRPEDEPYLFVHKNYTTYFWKCEGKYI